VKIKPKDAVIEGKVKITAVPRGHQGHLSRGGRHNDKRLARLRSRGSQLRFALKD
jgi:hypothetical protein